MTALQPLFQCWKPTAEYLDDPWGCFVSFVETLRTRGTRFVTMRDAIDGHIDTDEINVILDHHIDDYPLETEVICRWELEHNVRSSVYLYRRSTRCPAVVGEMAYEFEDLDLDLFRRLEEAGFEIGYHSNAVGQARESREGHASGQSLDAELLSRAREIFADDVEQLRRHFDIRTFIPHGQGQGNYLLTDLPESCRDMVWVYNNASSTSLGERRPSFSNWTDTATRGLRAQVIAGFGAYYVCRRENLQIKAALAGPGLHHVLLHAGRVARGMPYELLSRRPAGSAAERCDFDAVEHQLPLPLSYRSLVDSRGEDPHAAARRLAEGDEQLDEAQRRSGRYRLLTDDQRVLGVHQLISDRCLAYLARNEPFDRGRAGVKRPRRENAIRANRVDRLLGEDALTVDPVAVYRAEAESVRTYCPFFNEVYCQRLLTHLRDVPIQYDLIVLRDWFIHNPADLDALPSLLMRYDDSIEFQGRIQLSPAECEGRLRRAGASSGRSRRGRIVVQPDDTTGGAIVRATSASRRGLMAQLRRVVGR